MSHSLYSFAEVEAKKASPTTIRELVKNILRNSPACYEEMEPWLMPPGKSGSKAFDQAEVVRILLEHDKESGGQIASAMVATPSLTRRALWDVLQSVLRVAGFRMKHGRLIGLLEDMSQHEENGDQGQPDIQ
jgi:hypothetical protein